LSVQRTRDLLLHGGGTTTCCCWLLAGALMTDSQLAVKL